MKNIDDTDVVTYKSDNCARNDLAWLAYVVLPNGEYWGVRFNGATEEIARNKAIATWQHEQEKWAKLDKSDLMVAQPIVDKQPVSMLAIQDPLEDLEAVVVSPAMGAGDGRGHHFAGKVWMRHKETRELKRVVLTEIGLYEANGFERSGPRSK